MPVSEQTAFADPLREALRARADLPGAEILLDDQQVSELLGAEVTAVRMRIKPGRSLLLGLERTHAATAPQAGDLYWASIQSDPDKVANAERRAAKAGHDLARRAVPGHPGVQMVGGPLVGTEPKLGRALQRTLERLGTEESTQVLSFNPGRRLVLGLPERREVLRVDAGDLGRLERAQRLLDALAVPTLPVRWWSSARRAVAAPFWGRGDLTGCEDTAVAERAAARAGSAVARLHTGRLSTGSPGLHVPRARIGRADMPVLEDLAALLPQERERIRGLDARIRSRLTTDLEDPSPHRLGIIHGDLSPDQVLLDESAQIRLIDLDRTGCGPRGADLGSWIAACRLGDQTGVERAFRTAYCETGAQRPIRHLGAWTARALLSYSLDRVRRMHEDGLVFARRCLDLAESAIDEELPA